MDNRNTGDITRRKFIALAGVSAAALLLPAAALLRNRRSPAYAQKQKPPIKADASGCFRSKVVSIPR